MIENMPLHRVPQPAAHQEQVKKYYNQVQKSYNRNWMNEENLAMHLGFWYPKTESLHQALINENQAVADALSIRDSDFILDAGCGVGGTAIWLAEKYRVKVAGVNIVEKQIAMAKDNAKKRCVDKLTSFSVNDYACIDFADETFTKAYAIESICHAKEKKSVLKEIYRVLKPGAKLVIVDAFLKKTGIPADEKVHLNDWYEGWACPDLAVLDNFIEDLEEIGFSIMNQEDATEEIMPSSKILFHHCRRFYRIKTLFAGLGLISKEDFYNTKASVGQYFLYENKVLSHVLISAQKG